MITAAYNSLGARASLANKLPWLLFIAYILLSGYTMLHHELWFDEVHSWNIAKGSHSFADLVYNRRYEGHPPGWYSILWVISKCTRSLAYMQAAQWVLACLTVMLILFFSPLPRVAKILMPFGYYFLFEYGILSRNYVAGVLLACAICVVMHKEFKYKILLYYVLLFCLSNIHLLCVLLAAALHLYFLLMKIERKTKKSNIVLHIALGAIVLLPALYFIIPPPESPMNAHFWVDQLSKSQRLTIFSQAPLRCFIPIPAWWKYNCWDTQFLIDAENNHPLLKVVNPCIAVILLALCFLILKKNKKSMALFGINLLLSFILAFAFFPMTSERYAGFIFIGFIIAWWLYCYETPVAGRNSQSLVNILLGIQAIAGFFIVLKDIRLPFSNFYTINQLVKEVPAGEKLVTDYRTLNAYVAFTDKPAYCVDLQKNMLFVVWADDIAALRQYPNRYSTGFTAFFQKENVKSAYMVSEGDQQALFRTDTLFSKSFDVQMVDKREGAIRNGDDLYLYKVGIR